MSLQKQAYEKVFGKGDTDMKGRLSLPMPFFNENEIGKLDADFNPDKMNANMPFMLQNVNGVITGATISIEGDIYLSTLFQSEL